MLVLPASVDPGEFYAQRFGPASLPDTAPDTIRSSAIAGHVQSIQARLYGKAQVGAASIVVVGEDLGWPALPGVQPSVLGPEAAKRLGAGTGSSFTIGNERFTVLQVADAVPDQLEAAVFMPVAAAQRLLGAPGKLSALRLGGCWCRLDPAALASEVEKLLPGTKAITVAGMLNAQKGTIATMKRYSAALATAGLLLVAGMVAAVVASQARRRAREIGLLAAIGTPPHQVARLFSLQAAGAAALGAAAGWAMSFPVARWVGPHLLGALVRPSADLLVPAVLLAAALAWIAASIPARRAAALDPAVVLRES
jgi:ABC-type lipoprotein release transport system permease subunit